MEWAARNADALREDWDRARARQPLKPVPALE